MAAGSEVLLRPNIARWPQLSDSISLWTFEQTTRSPRDSLALSRRRFHGLAFAAVGMKGFVQGRAEEVRSVPCNPVTRGALPILDVNGRRRVLSRRASNSICVTRPKRREKEQRFACIAAEGDDQPSLEEEVALPDTDEVRETVAIKLPGRRTLQIQFTCNACGTRSTRLLNPFAFARGTVFVQCAGCNKYHQLVDNLGLVKEYNLKEERTKDTLMTDAENLNTFPDSP